MKVTEIVASTFLTIILLLVGGTVSPAQSSDTVINARYLLKVIGAVGMQSERIIEHEFTITLKPTGVTQQHQTGGLTGPKSPTVNVTLGSDSQPNVRYRVINTNTIARVIENQTFKSTLTIRVAGNRCRLSYQAVRKPGHEFIVAFAYRGGPAGRFRGLQMVGQHCEIK